MTTATMDHLQQNHTGTSTAPPPSFRSQPVEEEEPPPYTPAVDVYQGERVLEVGPRRPFQQPVQQPAPTTRIQPQSTGRLTPHTTGLSTSSFSSYRSTRQPQSLLRQITGQIMTSLEEIARERSSNNSPYAQPRAPSASTTTYSPPIRAVPPPLPPRRYSAESAAAAQQTRPEPPSHPQSDFAREFYAAGSGEPESEPEQASTPPSSPDRQRRLSEPAEPTDVGRPSETPIPGRPLLQDGKILIYPGGHWCKKCQNTGYKNSQPSKPCARCWKKYGKPYTGALMYAPTSNVTPSLGATSFQRPLPAHVPEQPPSSSTPSLQAERPRTLQRARSQNQVTSPTRAASTRCASGPSSCSRTWNLPPRPPSHITVVTPGDPRIGGRLCWQCHGSGQRPSLTAYLLGEGQKCFVCNGLGRIVR